MTDKIHPLLREPNDDLIYMASAYSHPHDSVRAYRHGIAARALDALTDAGHIVFSPIVHSHYSSAFRGGGLWKQWQRIDERFVEKCDEVLILVTSGYDTSVGVKAEVEFSESIGKPVSYATIGYCDPDDGSPSVVILTPVFPGVNGIWIELS